MIFTIDLEGFEYQYRLQKDGSWKRRNKKLILLESDFISSDPKHIRNISPHRQELNIEEMDFIIDPATIDMSHDRKYLNCTSTVFRREYPSMPSKDQLRSVIDSGDDSCSNSLVLNIYGLFELRPRDEMDISLNDPTIVVRHETFDAGNDYVGKNAALDNAHINTHYNNSLESWIYHLETGSTQMYSDIGGRRAYIDILKELDSIKDKWRDQY